MRKLSSVRVIEEIQPIEGADKIVKARIGGWYVVTAIDNGFKVGDLVIYFEIDSWIPNKIAPFLTRDGHFPKEYNGIPGERLRTIKLRGQISQGLIMPLQVGIDAFIDSNFDEGQELMEMFFPGADLTELLGIQKWEAPIAPQLAGKVAGSFPHFIRKTDEERCQNLVYEIFDQHKDEDFEVTIKLDGSSMTIYNMVDEFSNKEQGVCSRNLSLKIGDENSENTFIKTARESGMLDALKTYGFNIALQGELMGPGVQGNREGLAEHEFYCYNIWNIDEQCYYDPLSRGAILQELRDLGAKIKHVPIVADASLTELGITNINELLAYAEGPSLNHQIREGLVFKSHQSNFSFKVISNKFLLKGGD